MEGARSRREKRRRRKSKGRTKDVVLHIVLGRLRGKEGGVFVLLLLRQWPSVLTASGNRGRGNRRAARRGPSGKAERKRRTRQNPRRSR